MRGWQWAIVSVVLVVVLGVGGLLLSNEMGWFGLGDRLDMATVEVDIARDLTRRTGDPSIVVDCDEDDVPAEKGRIDDCTARDSTGSSYAVRVTQDDDRGHYTWVLLP